MLICVKEIPNLLRTINAEIQIKYICDTSTEEATVASAKFN